MNVRKCVILFVESRIGLFSPMFSDKYSYKHEIKASYGLQGLKAVTDGAKQILTGVLEVSIVTGSVAALPIARLRTAQVFAWPIVLREKYVMWKWIWLFGLVISYV